MSDITLSNMNSVGRVCWFVDGGDGNHYWVSEYGDVMRPLKPYRKGKSPRIYYNMVIGGRLRRISAERLAAMTDATQEGAK